MQLAQDFAIDRDAPVLPRACGRLRVASKRRSEVSCLDRLYSAGVRRSSTPSDAVEAIIVNTSGGLTGGDRFEIDAEAGAGSQLVMTTQAAERAYRSTTGSARMRTRLRVGPGATLHWLPQEMLVFDGSALDRRLEVDLDDTGVLIAVEPVVFGRTAMGETVARADFLDLVRIRRGNTVWYADRVALTGDITARLNQMATTGGLTAMASALYVGPRAQSILPVIRGLLPDTGGASLVRPDTIAVRLLARDGFTLRATLCPLLEALSEATLPRSWRL
ncbi:MAG: urease accessory protein UreD [Roseovarius sp.]